MSALTLTLPMPPNLANSRMHWRKKNRMRRGYLNTCDMFQMQGKVPPPPRTPLSPVTIASTLYCWAFHDDDNALHRGKWAYDWLTSRGYIVDDKRPHCRFTIPEQVIDRADQRLVLTISPLTENEP